VSLQHLYRFLQIFSSDVESNDRVDIERLGRLDFEGTTRTGVALRLDIVSGGW
jgi:hypothetical protein